MIKYVLILFILIIITLLPLFIIRNKDRLSDVKWGSDIRSSIPATWNMRGSFDSNSIPEDNKDNIKCIERNEPESTDKNPSIKIQPKQCKYLNNGKYCNNGSLDGINCLSESQLENSKYYFNVCPTLSDNSVYEPTNIQQLMGKKFDNITCNMPGTAINGDTTKYSYNCVDNGQNKNQYECCNNNGILTGYLAPKVISISKTYGTSDNTDEGKASLPFCFCNWGFNPNTNCGIDKSYTYLYEPQNVKTYPLWEDPTDYPPTKAGYLEVYPMAYPKPLAPQVGSPPFTDGIYQWSNYYNDSDGVKNIVVIPILQAVDENYNELKNDSDEPLYLNCSDDGRLKLSTLNEKFNLVFRQNVDNNGNGVRIDTYNNKYLAKFSNDGYTENGEPYDPLIISRNVKYVQERWVFGCMNGNLSLQDQRRPDIASNPEYAVAEHYNDSKPYTKSYTVDEAIKAKQNDRWLRTITLLHNPLKDNETLFLCAIGYDCRNGSKNFYDKQKDIPGCGLSLQGGRSTACFGNYVVPDMYNEVGILDLSDKENNYIIFKNTLAWSNGTRSSFSNVPESSEPLSSPPLAYRESEFQGDSPKYKKVYFKVKYAVPSQVGNSLKNEYDLQWNIDKRMMSNKGVLKFGTIENLIIDNFKNKYKIQDIIDFIDYKK